MAARLVMSLHTHRKRWTRLALFGAAGVLLAILGTVAFITMAQGVAPGGSGVKSLAFRNSSASTHADPSDLRLVDASRQSSPAIQDGPGCTHWSRTEFNNGATLGPLTICFRPASAASPLTLRWAPDMGLVCCEADLKIQ